MRKGFQAKCGTLCKLGMFAAMLWMITACDAGTGTITNIPSDTVKVVPVVPPVKGDPTPSAGFKVELQLRAMSWLLKNGTNTKTIPAGKGVMRLSYTRRGGFNFADAPDKLAPTVHFARRRAPIVNFGSAFKLTGSLSKGQFRFDVNGTQQSELAWEDCGSLDLYLTGGNVYVSLSPAPIHVTVSGTKVVYQREGSDKQTSFDIGPGKNRWPMAPCLDPDGINRVLLSSGGLTAIDFVDNIIDPDAIQGQSNQDSEIAKLMEEIKRETRRWITEKKDYPCDEVSNKQWPTNPVACFPLNDATITIYCNTTLVIVSGGKTTTVDLAGCGASLEVIGDKIALYDGCTEGASPCQ